MYGAWDGIAETPAEENVTVESDYPHADRTWASTQKKLSCAVRASFDGADGRHVARRGFMICRP
jgi:hypothetical protein